MLFGFFLARVSGSRTYDGENAKFNAPIFNGQVFRFNGNAFFIFFFDTWNLSLDFFLTSFS